MAFGLGAFLGFGVRVWVFGWLIVRKRTKYYLLKLPYDAILIW